jgi:hypothetical protein
MSPSKDAVTELSRFFLGDVLSPTSHPLKEIAKKPGPG